MRNEIVIDAPVHHIFERASATDRWPDILPHYRYVRVLRVDGNRRVVEMAARRPFGDSQIGIRVRWRAEQTSDPQVPQIAFRHLGGWTKGMQVYWQFSPLEDGRTLVQIDHELHSPLAPVIARFFIDPIAARTLRTLKQLCESTASSGESG